ncbi:exodeoxyribonuclease 7 large subunit [Xylanibacter ruminicola]|uniref:Exodeoxyribonuclease 7 large subunit n=2 Tax=Xylanibacter ruminicola TaxID=839 RepID=D5EW11_XYLR2|nr:exodeoxyribonuclease VII large subunit [Xylanibacter ruminicola]ADE81202.1 exodeoxyribonuclease VII, large subunit [Xylanibacter ruminicola 23]GJG32578.1 exodeoxyribonuclease 7 large subunit [Xylanibacter ruminicola]SEH94176.1 exodeoxyribonuclease VII large subunit [Xylanibacter ruminicola]
MNTERHITLFELNRLVREAIEDALPMEYWVEAELSECRESRGHCYMELIQKDEQTATPIAKASAKCWANKWLTIRPYFERTTGQQLHAGMKVLLQVYPQFHEAYGFSWIVTDIDPTYTLGDMARKRQEIIQKLKAEGVFDLQKELQLPVFCQRIAVISSQTAAGYGDFCNQLADNPYGFKFETQLFPAIMQGEGVEQSIISALEQIYDMPFDCVVIIRGGGATSDMSGFDTLALAENVANFPIPIITGIGHERDESILDMISHTRVKTPTAAAALLIDHLKGVLETIEGAQSMITHYVQQKFSIANSQLSIISEAIPRLFSIVKTRQEAKIDALYTRLPMLIERRFTSERHRLQLMDEKLKALDPTLLLARGYSITMHNGRAVKDASQLPPGAEIETRLAKGTIHSVIKSV